MGQEGAYRAWELRLSAPEPVQQGFKAQGVEGLEVY